MEGSAYLIQKTYSVDRIGQRIPDKEKIEILCHIKSIGQNEFFKAGQSGISPDVKIVTQAVNYNGEQLIECEKELYRIYRTFRSNDSDEIELYCAKKVI